MTSTVLAPAPDPGAEALIREARRRQRRRCLAIGGAVAAITAVAAGAGASLHAGSWLRRPGLHRTGRQPGPKASGAIGGNAGTTVLMWPAGPGQDGAIALDNLGTGRRGQAAPVVDPGEYQPVMLASGRIVYVTAGSVRATDAVTGKTRALGEALAFAPSAVPGTVWLEHGYYGSGAVTVRTARLAGGRHGPLITLPRGTKLVSGTDAGLLLEPRSADVGGPFWLWTPGTAPKALPYSSFAEGFAASPGLVAYGDSCAGLSTAQGLRYGGNFGYYACRTLRVLDVATGRLRSFAAPPGTIGWTPTHGGNWAWSGSEIAPSGQMMAAQAVLPPASHGTTRVFVLHLTGHAQPTAVPSSTAFLLSVTAWSPGSSWLFYQGPHQHMQAYRPSTGQVRSSTTPCCQYAVMATMNSPQR